MQDSTDEKETFHPGPSGIHLAAYPPKERWQDWTELDPKAWPRHVQKHYTIVPTTCFNCESACGLLAYVDRETLEIRKFEGNPLHPGSRGRNCAKGPATLNQFQDPDRILYPLKRTGARGEGKWEQVSWDVALDDIAGRIRQALLDGRRNEVMYHVGRPGEDGYTERVLAAWGIDGHNSHTNICSSGARAGYHFWMGFDRPSPDHANANVILLISAHLESGHYFNPHAQRVIEGKKNGAKLIVFDTRLSNTATHADWWIAPYPGSEAAILLAVASHVIRTRRYDREFVRRWWNWQEFLDAEAAAGDVPPWASAAPSDEGVPLAPGRGPATPSEFFDTSVGLRAPHGVGVHPGTETDVQDSAQEREFARFEARLAEMYSPFTFEYAARESGVDARTLEEIADAVASAGTRLSTHNWRSAASGNLGGWQVARCLFLLNALMGAVGTQGGTAPNGWNKFVPKPIHMPPHPDVWNGLNWPVEYPLAIFEMSFLLPHLLRTGRGRLSIYFSRVYNPVWTNPDGFAWIDALTDADLVGLHVALTPTWSETSFFADYVLPVGLGPERHDVHSYEQYDGQWIGFRQPVLRTARERLGQTPVDTREANPGAVWEENEFWIELSWRIDPDGRLGIRRWFESKAQPGEKLTVDEYYAHMFEHSVPGLPEAAAAQGLAPLEYMRRYGAFEIARGMGPMHEEVVPTTELEDVHVDAFGRAFTRSSKPASPNIVPQPAPDGDAEGRRAAGVLRGGQVVRGFPTPSGLLEFYSPTLADWGWPEYAIPTYIRSHIHPSRLAEDQMPLIATFRLPVHIHTRSANAKWLDEIAHTNPLWLHTHDAARLEVATGDLVRVETAIGHFVVKAWVTEGIRPGVVACSHHMGRWRLSEVGQRQLTALAALERNGLTWRLRREQGAGPFASSDPDTGRIWWSDVGVHQNLTFPVQPDPISGMHCWHQAVSVWKAQPDDRYGDVVVDEEKARRAFQDWLALTRPADRVSPDGTRRPYWMMRPLRPTKEAYRLGPVPPPRQRE